MWENVSQAGLLVGLVSLKWVAGQAVGLAEGGQTPEVRSTRHPVGSLSSLTPDTLHSHYEHHVHSTHEKLLSFTDLDNAVVVGNPTHS